MHRKATSLALLLVLLAVAPLAMAQGQSPDRGGISVPISGTFAPSATTGPLSNLGTGTLTGTLDIQRFVVQNGQLNAVGTLTASLTNAAGQVVRTVVAQVTVPVTNQVGSCEILHLDLGPLNLDLLGLQISLSQVVLDIVAQSGAGNLLGNLLCAIANLLNGGGPLAGLANLLNQLLAILG